MSEIYSRKDIDTLSRIHHKVYYKMLHTDFEDNFPQIKGVTPLEMGVLRVISENPGAMLYEIAQNLNTPKSTLTSVVDRLEKRGYVNRVISSKDRRSFELLLTRKGRSAQQQHIESEELIYKKIASALDTPEEVATLITLLEKIVERL
jgi:DNA-binding MarR family transcriptional regulator